MIGHYLRNSGIERLTYGDEAVTQPLRWELPNVWIKEKREGARIDRVWQLDTTHLHGESQVVHLHPVGVELARNLFGRCRLANPGRSTDQQHGPFGMSVF